MTRIVIMKNEQGKLEGFSPEDERAYAKWRRLIVGMEVGETLEFNFAIPRDPRHHRRFFWKIRTLLDHTEAVSDMDTLRTWLILGAGYSEPDGAGGLRAQSLAFAEMDEADFAELHRKVDDFLWTPHAQEVLWPHLHDQARAQAMDTFFFAVRRCEEAPC